MQLPVPDFNDPNFSQASHHNPLDEFLDCKLKQGKRIIIHCAAGKELTGTI
jgi:protein-tyrosine phosphatase